MMLLGLLAHSQLIVSNEGGYLTVVVKPEPAESEDE